jgi:hypothetical protein
MKDILLLIAGAVVGAVVGILFDRLYRKYESLVRVHIQQGCYEDVTGKGVSIKVTNIGRSALPDCHVSLVHPTQGSFTCEVRDTSGELLPRQTTTYKIGIIKKGSVEPIISQWFLGPLGGEGVADPNVYVFRLVLRNSDQVLYENAELGKELAESIRFWCKMRDDKTVARKDNIGHQERFETLQ